MMILAYKLVFQNVISSSIPFQKSVPCLLVT